MKNLLQENDLFEIVKRWLLTDLESAEDPYSKWDCISHKHKIYVELKCRATHYGDLLIEKKKWDALQAKADMHGYRAVYINSTPEGIFVFVLSEMREPHWTVKKMPATSQFSNRSKIDKTVAFLPVSTAKKTYPVPATAGVPLVALNPAA